MEEWEKGAGVMEYWSNGVMVKREQESGKMFDRDKRNSICRVWNQYSNTPMLHHSSLTLLQSLAKRFP